MTESRTELIAWVNDLLQINISRIEEMGKGAAHCQIMDSIYGDVAMSKVKFNARQEYEYVQNFKVLQGVFRKHGLDKVIPVERLIKCKFQDNLEFTQWMKKYWDTYFPGGSYDALQRRKGEASTHAPVSASPARKMETRRAAPVKLKQAQSVPSVPTVPPTSSLLKDIRELKETVEGLEKERDFYFTKLRDIEVLVQQRVNHVESEEEGAVLKEIHDILYATEEGFEIPEDESVIMQGMSAVRIGGEQETF